MKDRANSNFDNSAVFDIKSGRVLSPEEVARYIEKSYNATLIRGYGKAIQGYLIGRREYVTWLGYEAIFANKKGLITAQWQTEPLPEKLDTPFLLSYFSMGMGIGSVLPQPTGSFELFINQSYILSFHVTKETKEWVGKDIKFIYMVRRVFQAPQGACIELGPEIKDESCASFGYGLLLIPNRMTIPGKPLDFMVKANLPPDSKRWFKVDMKIKDMPVLHHPSGWLPYIFRKEKKRYSAENYHVYFGDIHTHCGESANGLKACGQGSIDDNYKYAENVSRLDFYCLTDHDTALDKSSWQKRIEKAQEYYKPGEFATLLGFEWTSRAYGHRNVYFRSLQGDYFPAAPPESVNRWDASNPTPDDLWKFLKGKGCEFITVPHHPAIRTHCFSWSTFNSEFDRVVELYSCWGSSEYFDSPEIGEAGDQVPGNFAQDILADGHCFGFIASSDGHDGHPGNAQGWSTGHIHISHRLGSGRIAVFASELTREAIFDAIYHRRCYATTGSSTVVDFRINDQLMGSEIYCSENKPLILSLKITGTTTLKNIYLIKNNFIFRSFIAQGSQFEFSTELTPPDSGQTDYYYVKAQQMDDELAWSSPIWVINSSENIKR